MSRDMSDVEIFAEAKEDAEQEEGKKRSCLRDHRLHYDIIFCVLLRGSPVGRRPLQINPITLRPNIMTRHYDRTL